MSYVSRDNLLDQIAHKRKQLRKDVDHECSGEVHVWGLASVASQTTAASEGGRARVARARVAMRPSPNDPPRAEACSRTNVSPRHVHEVET